MGHEDSYNKAEFCDDQEGYEKYLNEQQIQNNMKNKYSKSELEEIISNHYVGLVDEIYYAIAEMTDIDKAYEDVMRIIVKEIIERKFGI